MDQKLFANQQYAMSKVNVNCNLILRIWSNDELDKMQNNQNEPPGMFHNFIKRETLAHVFFFEFSESFKNTYFTEYLRATASE